MVHRLTKTTGASSRYAIQFDHDDSHNAVVVVASALPALWLSSIVVSAMRARHNILLSLLAICCCTSQAGGDEFYRRFLSLVGTNKLMAVTSPILVDTNNTAPKLTNSVVNLIDVCARGEIAGVYLGMTMEEVAASWGKPRYLWSRCFGGPRFCYNDVSVIFDPSSNSVRRVIVEKLPLLHGKLSNSSTADQFAAVLGKAVTRKE